MVLLLSLTATSVLAGEYETPTALTNVRIITGEGAPIESGTILMAEGRIVAVGTSVEIPDYAEIVDATGMVAYPGFIDAHSYLGIPKTERTEAERKRLEDETPDPKWGPYVETLEATRRGIRPQVRAYDLFAPEESALEDYREIGMTTALVAPRTGILGGTSMVVDLSGEPIRRVIVRDKVCHHAAFNPGEPGSYPETIMGAMAEFRQVMLDGMWYTQAKKYEARHPRLAERVPVDAALDELQSLRGGTVPVVFEANTEPQIHRALNLAAEFNLPVIISGAKEAYKMIDRLRAEKVSLIVSLKFDDEPEYDPEKEAERAKEYQEKPDPEHPALYEPMKLRAERRRLWEEQVDNVIRLHEAGIKFALTTRETEHPAEFFKNLRLVIERGLPVDAAVGALTSQAARLFRLEDQLGSIAPGKIANVTVLTAPIEEMDKKKKPKVKWVFIDGKKFEFKLEDEQKKKKEKKERIEAGEEEPSAEDIPPWEEEEEEEQKPEPSTQPASQPATQPTEPPPSFPMPTWACEIEADRKPKTQTGGNVLVKNAMVITMTGSTIEHGSVLIEQGVITGVGPNLAAPEGTTVLDATGRYVIPGFVDAHSHMALEDVNEGTVSISAEVRMADVVTNKQVEVYRALAGGMTTMHCMHGSANTIGGQNVILKLKYGRPVKEMFFRDAPRTIKFALGENVKQSNWGDAVRGTRFPATRMGVESTLRRAFVGAQRYVEEWNEHQRRIAAGEDVPPLRRDLRLEALADVVAGALRVQCHCYRADEVLRLLAVAEDFGFRIQCLQHILEGYRIAPEIARHGCGSSTFSDFWSYKIEAYDAIPYNAAAMTDAGICASVNSDSADFARYFNLEAAKCVKWGGLNAEEALALVTINPARQLDIDKRVGSIEVGKDGDLAIFDGHPLNSLSKCVMTLIDGEVFFEGATGVTGATGSTGATGGPGATGSLPARADSEVAFSAKAAFNPKPLPKLPSRDLDRSIPPAPYGLYAITGATVHPISGPPIENGIVTIRDGKIDAVGKDALIRAGSAVIKADGLHVYPGLIDAGSRLGLIEIGSVFGTDDLNDVAKFQPDLRTSSAINPHSAHVDIARASGITTALVQPGGGYISGQSSLIHLDGWTAPEMGVADPVALYMSIPVLPVHLPRKDREKTEKDHDKQFREVEEWVSRAKRYAQDRITVEDTPLDVVLESMIPYVRGEKPVVMRANGYKSIVKQIEFAEKHGLKMVLFGGNEAWKLADKLAEKRIPVILSTPMSYPSSDFEVWDSVYRCASILDQAGVEFCFATDSASNAYDLTFQAGMAAAHGLDPDKAVYALTLGAAKIMGVDDRLGSLEPGKLADLIVTTDTPIQTVSQVTHMFINGKPVDLNNKHRQDYDRFKARPAPDLPPAADLRGPPSLTKKK